MFLKGGIYGGWCWTTAHGESGRTKRLVVYAIAECSPEQRNKRLIKTRHLSLMEPYRIPKKAFIGIPAATRPIAWEDVWKMVCG